MDLLFHSPEEIEQISKERQTLLKKDVDLFIEQSKANSFEEAYATWLNLCCQFFQGELDLFETSNAAKDSRIKKLADSMMRSTSKKFFEAQLQRKDLLSAFVHNGIHASSLTPQERYITEELLRDYLKNPKIDLLFIQPALDELGRYEKQNFSVFKSPSIQYTPSLLKDLRILTANIISFPGNLTYYYGGISPWKNRVEKIASIIKKEDAHIVCLQEVWDPAARMALVNLLQDRYPFFLYGAGNQFSTLDLMSFGFGSGLLVASKIPFDSISFTPFPRNIPEKGGVRRGALLVNCCINGQDVFFVTTHMQHGNNKEAISIRKEELLLCHALLEQTIKTEHSWGFLVGDINIYAFTPEFKPSSIQYLFRIPYLEGQTHVDAENATETDYFDDIVHASFDKRSEVPIIYGICDYCICPSFLKKISTTQKVPLFSIDKPMEALSDHHGLLTIWDLTGENISKK